MRKDFIYALLLLVVCAGCNNRKHTDADNDADTVKVMLDDRTISFYYNWYGNPEVDGGMKHWAHPIAPTPGPPGDAGVISGLDDDIACNFYPELGTYSSNDVEVVRKHIQMHVKANIGVLSVTWWGESDYGNKSVSLLLDEAAKVGAKVCFHIEPFNGRSPQTIRENIQHIMDTYGNHPAFYRTQGKPLFFIYDSYLIKPEEWAGLFGEKGEISVRNTKYDGLFIGLTLKESELADIEKAGMDGFIPILLQPDLRMLLLLLTGNQCSSGRKSIISCLSRVSVRGILIRVSALGMKVRPATVRMGNTMMKCIRLL